MAAIAPSGAGLPAAATTTTATPPAAPGTGMVADPLVAGPAQPPGPPTDQLDVPHPTYPSLTQGEVAVLEAIGTPAELIAQIALDAPTAEGLDEYIQSHIMQNPEGWDQFVSQATGQPLRLGAARAGLQRIIPGIELPPPAMGTPGEMPDFDIDPEVAAQNPDTGNWLTPLVIGAALVGGGLLAWNFFKGRSAGAEQALDGVAKLAGGEGASGAKGLLGGIVDRFSSSPQAARRVVEAAAEGATGGGAAAGVTHSMIDAVGAAARSHSIDPATALSAHLLDKALDTRQIGELAAALQLMRQNHAAGVTGASTQGIADLLGAVGKLIAT